MKNNYLDLTLEEFLDTITNQKKKHCITIKSTMDESYEITGDKQTLIDVVSKIISVHEGSSFGLIKNLEKDVDELRKKDDYVFTRLSDIEIYNYLSHITKEFDTERVEILLWDMIVYIERIKAESLNEYLKNGWEIPQTEWEIPQTEAVLKHSNGEKKFFIEYDYEKMIHKTHKMQFWASWGIIRVIKCIRENLNCPTMYRYVSLWFYISFLHGKIKIDEAYSEAKGDILQLDKSISNPLKDKFTEQQAIDLHTMLCREELMQPDIDSFLYWFGVADEKPDKVKHIKWIGKSKSLLAYFIDKVIDKYNVKHGERRLIKPFETMFNVTGITNSINEYRNKTGQRPVNYEIIDNILK
jgi:hypothetical protein